MSRFPVITGNSHEQKSMEWYWGSDDVDDLVVPRNQESLERISSPISWTQWGATAPGACSCFPKKNSFNGINVGDRQDLDLNGRTYNGVMNMNMNYSVQQREHHDYDYDSSPMCPGGQYNGSFQWPHEEDQAITDRMDDIFLYNKSLLEEDGTGEDNPFGNTFNYHVLEQQYIPSNSHCSGSFKHLKTHNFSPSMDRENAKDSWNDFTGEESEASVLQDLEWVISLFTDETRICLRDALYRLAENSKQPSHMGQDGDIIVENHPMLTKDDENPRIEEIEVKEMKTNAIDRAVAGLVFSVMNFTDEDQSNFSLYQHTVSYCPPLARLAEDVEVAIVPC